MKKFCSILLTVLMLMTLALPAFAAENATPSEPVVPVEPSATPSEPVVPVEPDTNPNNPVVPVDPNATPGEIAQDLAEQLNNAVTKEEQIAIATKMTEVLQNENIVVNLAMTRALATLERSYLEVFEKDKDHDFATLYNSDSKVNITSVKRNGSVVVLNAETKVQSPTGTMICIDAGVDDGSEVIFDMTKQYIWKCGNQTGEVEVVVDNGICFFAPHFSTYTIMEKPEAPVAPETVKPDAAKPGPVAPQILKKTGADLSFAWAGIFALCAVVMAGSAVMLKKRVSDR